MVPAQDRPLLLHLYAGLRVSAPQQSKEKSSYKGAGKHAQRVAFSHRLEFWGVRRDLLRGRFSHVACSRTGLADGSVAPIYSIADRGLYGVSYCIYLLTHWVRFGSGHENFLLFCLFLLGLLRGQRRRNYALNVVEKELNSECQSRRASNQSYPLSHPRRQLHCALMVPPCDKNIRFCTLLVRIPPQEIRKQVEPIFTEAANRRIVWGRD
jgi:hypothetical protein